MLKTVIDLDDSTRYAKHDPSNMRQRLEQYPRLLVEGWQASAKTSLPDDYRGVSRVLVHGMGGSAIPGEIVSGLLDETQASVSIAVHHDYGVPAWVGPDTLVISSSHSGETEEVLSGIAPALAQGAKVIALTSGGKLAHISAEKGLPVCQIPSEGPPRTLLPCMVGALLGLMSRLGLVAISEDAVTDAAKDLEGLQARLAPPVATSGNEAKGLARDLFGRLPIIYTAPPFSAVGQRWKVEINENAKTLAIHEELPEAHHNAVAGLERAEGVFVVLLRPTSLSRPIARRFDITEAVLERLNVPYGRVTPSGPELLGQVLGGALLGDFVSYYLALLMGVDPTSIETIDGVKKALSAE